MNDVTKTRESLGYFMKQIAFVSLYCDRNMNDAVSTRKHSATPRVFTRHSSG